MRVKRRTPSRLSDDEDSDESVDDDLMCGLYGWKCSGLQCFANVQSFTFFFSLVGMMTQTLSLYINSQVPNIEKQFGLTSSESGLLMSFNDIGFLLCSLFISSLARFVHIPRFLFYCTITYGISGIICSIPHYLTPRIDNMYTTSGESLTLTSPVNISQNFVTDKTTNMPLCVPEMTSVGDNLTTCDGGDRTEIFKVVSPEFRRLAIAIIAIGMMVQGIGKAPRSPFVTVYIDDNVEKRKTGFYSGKTRDYIYRSSVQCIQFVLSTL